jgi:DNA-binding beta-propeller fold protein YncE
MKRNAGHLILTVVVILVASLGAASAMGPDLDRKANFGESEARPAELLRPLPASFYVRIEQAGGQGDPTGIEPIRFDVEFGLPIVPASFTTADLIQLGSSTVGTWVIVPSGDHRHFVVEATGVTAGTVIPSLAPASVEAPGGESNYASASVDNSVTFGIVDCATYTFLYAAVWSPPQIYVYCVEADGSLTYESTVAAPGDVRDMQGSSDGKSLYYAHSDLTRYTISMDGSIVVAGTRTVGNGAFDDLLLDPTIGRYLYATHSRDGGTVFVYDTFVVASVPPQKQAVDGFYIPHGLAIDSAGQNLFVANYFLPDDIVSFPLLGDGRLDVFNAFVTDFTARPMYMVSSPVVDRLYWTETSGGSVITGRLNGPQVTYFDSDFSGWGARSLTIDDDGSHVYVANNNTDDIGVMGVAGNGGLFGQALVPTARRPEHILFHPNFAFLYVASAGDVGDDSTISIYQRTGSGNLLALTPETIGSQGLYRLAIVQVSGP